MPLTSSLKGVTKMPEEMDLSNLGKYALSIGVAVIIIALIAIILQTIRDDRGIVPDLIASHVNDTLTYANNTALTFSENRLVSGSEIVWNSTAKVLQTGNYTINYGSDETRASLTITNISGEHLWNDTNPTWNVSYDYYYGSSARNATIQGLEGQKTFASFLPIVAMAIAGMIIIGIALTAFLKGRFEQ